MLRTAMMLEDSGLFMEDRRGMMWRREGMEIYKVDRVASDVREEKRC